MKKIFSIIIIAAISIAAHAQKERTDAHIIGHVIGNGEHIPFATIDIIGTTIGTTTDETGHYQLVNVPVGKHRLRASFLGYSTKIIEVQIKKTETNEIHFNLEPDYLGLDEVTITGDRSENKRQDAPVVVSMISPKMFARTQSVHLGESLNFTPGLRLENNCQNCGFSQVRMNGMEGPYSQILINSRPIFSGLAGVYGLELIPTNMIDRVEVIRGGGSALYGSNAIAGTINLMLKDPVSNVYEFGVNHGLIGLGQNASELAEDLNVNFNTSLVSSDNKTGMSLYGFYRSRDPYDANGDEFSELSKIRNTTIGGRIFHRFSSRSKLSADFFNINESRRGGNKFDYSKHESDIAEAVDHNITTAAINFDQFFRTYDKFSAYASFQKVERDSYYGAEQSLSDYGVTNDLSYNLGTQYNARIGISELTLGAENTGASLIDTKLGYPDFENAYQDGDDFIIPHTSNTLVADQMTNTSGVFAQYELEIDKIQVSAGIRYDHFLVRNNQNEEQDKTGDVFSPRFTFKYDVFDFMQARLSYSQGYRAPQIFDEDLHIETSGSRQVIHVNAPNLEKETSRSFMASLDFNQRLGNTAFELLVEAFYTRLNNPFANEFGEPDENGTVIYTRINAQDGAKVQGVNTELSLVPGKNMSLKAGYTLQKSEYDVAQEFDSKQFFRSPEQYGFLSLNVKPMKKMNVSLTGNYTGKMLVPYFGPQIENPEDGELRESNPFFDLGFKISYDIRLNGASLRAFAGMKNVFNSYQNDFDSGIDRDPGYMYGPLAPRTIYFGVKVGNFLR